MSAKPASPAEQGLTALRVNWDAVITVALFFVSFALYARTAAPGVLDGDFGEFQTNMYLLGVSHTGYPLYFLLGKLWTLLMPVGSIAYRANVFSGLLGALALVLLYFALRTLDISIVVALLTSVLFGASRVEWSQAVIPDVYTLNAFFVVLVLWLAILWRMGRVPLWWVALGYGFSLTHHRTMVLLAPALGLFVLWGGGWAVLKSRTLLKTLAALVLPLVLYVYIPLRGASDVGVEYHPGNNVNVLALNVFYDLRFGPPGFLWERFTQVYLTLLIEQFTAIGFGFGLMGVVALAMKRIPQELGIGDTRVQVPPRQLLMLLGLAHVAQAAFGIMFWVVDSEIFFIPAFLTFLFFVAIGFEWAVDGLGGLLAKSMPQRSRENGSRRAAEAQSGWNEKNSAGSAALRESNKARTQEIPQRVAAVVVMVVLGAMCAYGVATNFPRNDQSNNDAADARWQEILAEPLEQNAILMGAWEDLTPLEYYQYVDKVRTDLEWRKLVIYEDQLKLVATQTPPGVQVRDLLEKGTPVYLTRHPADIETFGNREGLDSVPISSFWRMQARHTNRGSETARRFDAGQELRQLDAFPNPARAGDFVTLDMVWSSDALLEGVRFVLSVRDVSGKVWLERESLPREGRAGTATGATRELQGLFLPPDAPTGEYTLELAVLKREAQTPKPIIDDTNVVTVTLKVEPPDAPTAPERVRIPRELPATVGSAQFLGYDVTNPEPRGGDVLEFSSWWQNIAEANETFEIKLRDANDVETVLAKGALLPNAQGPLSPAQIVRARHEITIPPMAAAGYARILLSLNGQPLPPIRIALVESTRKFRVPIIRRPQLTLVGDALQLLGYKLDRTEYRAGETLPLTLYWSANETPDASYKVFVHLVDANGVLRTQQDSIPQNGALPTNRWFAGEYISDEYNLQLPGDLAAGEYRIVVGMYEEASGARVPLTDANGVRLKDDAVTLDDRITIRP